MSAPITTPKKTRRPKPKAETSYGKAKRISRQAFELLAAFKYGGKSALEKAFEATDDAIRKQTLRKAATEAEAPEAKKALDELAEWHFPEGLSTRGTGAMPKTLTAMTTKQRKRPFVVCRLPDSFAAKRGSVVDVTVTKVRGKEAVVLTMAEVQP